MIELKRDPKTGEVVAYEDGRQVGFVTTMGDMLDGNPSEAMYDAGRALGREKQPATARGTNESIGDVSGGRPTWSTVSR